MKSNKSDQVTVLSIQEFNQLLQSSTVAEIQQISVESLPRVIPDETIASAPHDKRKLLENIVFDLNMREVSERMQIESKYASEVSDALFYYSDYFGKENFNILKKKVTELAAFYKAWKITQKEDKRLAMLPKIKELNILVDAIRLETKSIIAAQTTLKKNIESVEGADKAHFKAEIDNLDYMVSRNQEKMGQYYYLRLLVIGSDMRHLSLKIKQSKDQMMIVQDKIYQSSQRLSKMGGGGLIKSFTKKTNNDLINKLQNEINDLLELKKTYEVPISETALIAWLDVVVDASLSEDSKENKNPMLGKVRMTLFHLLQEYCEQQESAAADVAQNPFSQASPENVIKFLLQSEEFILNYFKQKRIDTASWMGDLAESKVGTLDDIEKTLLKEMKKNNKIKVKKS